MKDERNSNLESSEHIIEKTVHNLGEVDETYVESLSPEEFVQKISETIEKGTKNGEFFSGNFNNLFEIILLPESKNSKSSGGSEYAMAEGEFKLELASIFKDKGYSDKQISNVLSGDSGDIMETIRDFYLSEKGRELIEVMANSNPLEDKDFKELINETPIEKHQELALHQINEGMGFQVMGHIFEYKGIDRELVFGELIRKNKHTAVLMRDILCLFPEAKFGADAARQILTQGSTYAIDSYIDHFDLKTFDFSIVKPWAEEVMRKNPSGIFANNIKDNIDQFSITSEEKNQIEQILKK